MKTLPAVIYQLCCSEPTVIAVAAPRSLVWVSYVVLPCKAP